MNVLRAFCEGAAITFCVLLTLIVGSAISCALVWLMAVAGWYTVRFLNDLIS